MCVLLTKDRKPRQYYYLKASTVGVMSLHAGISYSSRMQKLSCLTARKHAEETRRKGGTRAARQYVEGDSRQRCVLQQEGTEAKAASLHELPRSFDARVRNTTLRKIVDIRT
jgi:hypothetical protein